MVQNLKFTPHQNQYYTWQLTRQAQSGSMESLASTLVDAQVDLNPHQVDAALFACQNPLSHGVILADEVGLGKTIEAGLVILQHWAERKRRILIITPANLRKQWHQELQEKFGLQCEILESKNYNDLKKQGQNPFERQAPIICSYQFAKSKANDIQKITWDLAVLDEAHLYRLQHPLAQTLLTHAKNRTCPPAKLVFDYKAYGSKISTLEPYIGQSGQLTAILLTVTPLDNTDQHLIISAITNTGEILIDDDPEKLLRQPVAHTIPTHSPNSPAALNQRRQRLLKQTAEQNLYYFEQEVQKLDDWAEDLKSGLEQDIKDTDRTIKEIRRTTAIASTLDEKLYWQKTAGDGKQTQ